MYLLPQCICYQPTLISKWPNIHHSFAMQLPPCHSNFTQEDASIDYPLRYHYKCFIFCFHCSLFKISMFATFFSKKNLLTEVSLAIIAFKWIANGALFFSNLNFSSILGVLSFGIIAYQICLAISQIPSL